jgi:hypothetical protein
MRPNIDSCFDLLASGKLDGYLDIVGDFHTIITMNEGFIQIEDDRFLVYIRGCITICAGLAIQLDHSSFGLLLCGNPSGFKGPNVLSRHGYVLTSKRAFLFVELQYFRDIVDIVSRRVWVEAWRQIVFALIDLSNKFLQGVIDFAL